MYFHIGATADKFPDFFFCVCSRDVTHVPAYPASEAALNIIKTGATRQRELFYPWYIYFITVGRDFFPDVRDYFIQKSYSYTP